MADVAARREARRKRILENSQNRLQLISGKSDDNGIKEPSSVTPIPENFENIIEHTPIVNSVSKNSITNGGPSNIPESLDALLSRYNAGDGEILTNQTPSRAEIVSQEPPQLQTPLWKAIILYKYDIVLLSLLMQLYYAMGMIPLENTYIFVPLIVYCITKQIWIPKQNNSSVASILMLLNGMSPNIHKLLKVAFWIGALSQDAFIFLFTTVCTQSFLIMLRDSFIT